jgi:hypothetical protein
MIIKIVKINKKRILDGIKYTNCIYTICILINLRGGGTIKKKINFIIKK